MTNYLEKLEEMKRKDPHTHQEGRCRVCIRNQALEEVKPLLEEAVRETEKAFGGCKKCYGKGYGTQTLYVGNSRYREKQPTMVFCSCERGKQLQALNPNQP